MPTLTMRLGGITAGTYDAGGAVSPGIPGDKANGIEAELAAGKILPMDFGVTGALGIRARDKGLPIDWHVRMSAFKSFADVVSVSIAYDQWLSVSGIDIGGAGWSTDRFRELDEDPGNLEVGLGLVPIAPARAGEGGATRCAARGRARGLAPRPAQRAPHRWRERQGVAL